MPGPIRPCYTKAAQAAAMRKAMAHTWRCPVCEVGWRGTEAENECWACPTPTAGRKIYQYLATP